MPTPPPPPPLHTPLYLIIDEQLADACAAGPHARGPELPQIPGALWDGQVVGPPATAVAITLCMQASTGRRREQGDGAPAGDHPCVPQQAPPPSAAQGALLAHRQAVGWQVMQAVRWRAPLLCTATHTDLVHTCAYAARMAMVDATLRAAAGTGVSPGGSGRPRRRARGGPPVYLVDRALHLDAEDVGPLQALGVFGCRGDWSCGEKATT